MENQINDKDQNQIKQIPRKRKVNYWKISTLIFFVILVIGGTRIFWVKNDTLLKNQQNTLIEGPILTGNIITKSPSGKYLVRSLVGTNGVDGGFEIIDDSGFQQFELQEQMDSMAVLNEKNIVWNKDESVAAITYVPFMTFPVKYLKEMPRNAYLILWPMKENKNGSMEDKMLVTNKVINLGNGAYYGNNKEQVFYPVVSRDGKYIAIQTDLIHKISIYDFQGNKIEDLMTKYADVPLFSPEMYELEDGKYSPFLEYKWNETGDGILYRFMGTEKYYEVKLTSR